MKLFNEIECLRDFLITEHNTVSMVNNRKKQMLIFVTTAS